MADTRTPRPDLAALEYTNPGMITDRIFPMLPRAMRQGTLYFADIQTDVSAQTGRTAGTAPTTNLIADANTTFNLENDEFIDREEIPDGDIAGLGGLDVAQQVGARRGKRAVSNAVEDLTAANVLGNGSVTYTTIGSSFVAAVQLGYDTLIDYAGGDMVALVISSRLFSLVKRYEEVVDRFKFTGVLPAPSQDVRNISRDQLAAALGVDAVIVGNNTQWYDQAGAYQDRAALVKLPSTGVQPIEEPQAGRTLWFSPTGAMPTAAELFECHTWYSETELSEMVDVRAYAEQHVLNVEHIYGLDDISTTLLPS